VRYSFDIYSGAVRELQRDDYSSVVIVFNGIHELGCASVTMHSV
jgi:hypothetical protein